ncbi:MAG TPA: hypothetical protein VH107_01960 [Lacipirellulaceae bacterium]|nr:hypothetical protein [Lacipirellulaceae bacterium]
MHRHSATFAALTFALVVGCQPSKPKVASSPAAVGEVASPVAATPVPATPPSSDESTKPKPAAEASSDKPPSKADVPKKDATAPPPPKPQPERITILTPGGPLIMDATITVNGRPANEAFEKLIDGVLAAATPEKEKTPTWKALAANEEYLKGQQYGKPVRERDLKMWTDEYDSNHDGEIERDEAAAWLGRAAGRKMKPFSLRSSRSYSNVPSASSRIWKLLDTNGDGQLSADELQKCAKTLLAFDDDNDGVVTAEEFETLRDLLLGDGQASLGQRQVSRAAALYLEPGFADDRLNYLLTDLYAPQQDLKPESFPALTTAYKKLDANGDGLLDQDEISTLKTIPPHLQLTVDFTTGADKSPGKSSLKVDSHIPEISISAQPADDRAVITLGGTRLVLMAEDLTAAIDGAQAAAVASQIRLMVHDNCDPLCELLDADADGRLGEREISTAAKTLLEYDMNHDGILQSNELPYTMIVAFLRGERPEEDSFYRPRSVMARSAPAGTPEWFIHSDFNGDGDISRREFLGTNEQFSRLDTNGDGFINAAEAASAK